MAQARTNQIADAAITAAKIDVAVAGDGLAGGGGSALSVNVDGTTIETNADTLRVVADGIGSTELGPSAITEVLTSQFLAAWVQIDAFSATGADDVITTEVETAASITAVQTGTAGLGILSTGTANTAAATSVDNYKVQLRDAVTDQPIDDGAGGEVFGVLSNAATVWTITYYKADGSSHASFAASSLDLVFAEVFDLDTLPGTAILTGPSFGDIASGGGDHNHDSIYYTQTQLGSNANALGASLIGIEDAAGNFTATDIEAALAEIISDLASTASSLGASLVGIEDAAANFTATDVEGALAEIISDLASTANGLGASTIGVEDAAANFTATDLESVLAEMASNITSSADQQNGQTDTFTPTAGQTAFTLSVIPLGDSVVCSVNGVVQTITADYTVSGTTFTWLDTDFVLEIADTIQMTYVRDA